VRFRRLAILLLLLASTRVRADPPAVKLGFAEIAPTPASAPQMLPPGEKRVEAAPTPGYTAKLRGRLEADAINMSQTPRNKAIYGDYENVVGFRRARLGAEGTVGDQARYVAEFDFAGGNLKFRDVYGAVDNLPWVREVRVGHFRVPFGLEGQTSSNYFTFNERSPADTFDPRRKWGVGFYTYSDSERATLSGGVFHSGTNSVGNDEGDGNDFLYAARLTTLPWHAASDDHYRALHFGGSFVQSFARNDLVVFNQGPNNTLLQTSDQPTIPFVPTLQIAASQHQAYNAQAALVLGSLSFQAEWNGVVVEQLTGGPVFLHGSYLFASWYLTGEHRDYLPKTGTFGMTRVKSPFVTVGGHSAKVVGPGAWELTARLAYLDFRSANLPLGSNGLLQGVRETTLTLGVNWHLADQFRVMFNYVRAVPVDPNFGPSGADGFFLRTAVFW
jgi:phosphate-selective porin OprO/OprP